MSWLLKFFSLQYFSEQPDTSVSSSPLSNQFRLALIIGFHLLFALVPFFFLTVNEELFEFNKMILTYLITVLIIGAWTCRAIIEKKVLVKRTPLDIPIILFLVSQIISTFLSLHPRTSWLGYYTRFHGGLLSTFTYTALYYAYVSNVKLKDQARLLWTVVLAGLGITLYAIPEHFGHSPSCLLITGSFNASCWIQDVQTRVFGTFGQPNWLAAYVIMLFPITNFFVWKHSEKKDLKFFLSLFITLALFLTLLFTKSRSGFLGWILGTAVLTVGTLFTIFKSNKTKTLNSLLHVTLAKWGFSMLILPLIAALIFGTPFSPSAIDQLKNQPNPLTSNPQPLTSTVDRLEQGGTDSGEIRKIVWTGALRVWQRYPIFGAGVETFAYSYYQDRPVEHNNVSEWNFLYNKAHNEWLNFLANSGAVGLGTYLILQGMILFLFVQILFSKHTSQTKILSISLFSGLIAIHVSNFFGFSTVVVSTLMALFPAFALVSMETEKKEANIKSEKLDRFQLLALTLTILLTGVFLMRVLSIWLGDFTYAKAKTAYGDGRLNDALTLIDQALLFSPNEALYYELQGKINAQATLSLAEAGEPEAASQTATEAINSINKAIELNPVHLNFYRTQTLIFLTLAQFEPSFYDASLQSLEMARKIAPTEPKLLYDMGVIYQTKEATAEAEQSYQKSIELKPNFDTARFALGKLFESQNKKSEALEQYRYILENINPANEEVQERAEFLATQEAKKK